MRGIKGLLLVKQLTFAHFDSKEFSDGVQSIVIVNLKHVSVLRGTGNGVQFFLVNIVANADDKHVGGTLADLVRSLDGLFGRPGFSVGHDNGDLGDIIRATSFEEVGHLRDGGSRVGTSKNLLDGVDRGFHVLLFLVFVQVELDVGFVAESNDANFCQVFCYLEGTDDGLDEVQLLVKVRAPDTARRVDDENDICRLSTTTCKTGK